MEVKKPQRPARNPRKGVINPDGNPPDPANTKNHGVFTEIGSIPHNSNTDITGGKTPPKPPMSETPKPPDRKAPVTFNPEGKDHTGDLPPVGPKKGNDDFGFEPMTTFEQNPMANPVIEREKLDMPNEGPQTASDNPTGFVDVPDAAFEIPAEPAPGETTATGEPAPIGNPAAEEMTDAEKLEQVKVTVDQHLQWYASLKPMLFRQMAKVNERKVTKMERADKISRDTPLSSGENLGQFITGFNEYVDGEEKFDVPEKTIETIRKPLERIYMKRNIVMSDEMLVATTVGADLVVGVAMIITLKKVVSEKFEDAAHFYSQMKEKGRTPEDIQEEMAEMEAAAHQHNTNTGMSTVETAEILNPDE